MRTRKASHDWRDSPFGDITRDCISDLLALPCNRLRVGEISKMCGLVSFLLLTSLMALAAAPLAHGSTLTPGAPRIVDAGFFGIHFHRLQLLPGERATQTPWAPLNFGMVRLWDSRTRWADLEPAPGVWKFSRLDYYVNEANAHGAKVLYTLGSTPGWASARPDEDCSYGRGCAAEPRSLESWREYVRVISRRYRGKVCCYELWNEPKFSDLARDRNAKSFFTGSVADMVEMARIAHQVLSEEDPDAILLAPGFVNGADRLDMFLAAGGREHVQAIAYHFYAWDDENRMLRDIAEVRTAMRKNGVAHMPLWNTETGVEVHADDKPLPKGTHKRISREEAAAMMVRQMVLSAFAGIDRHFYYSWDHGRTGMVDHAGQPYPARDAMLLAQRWLLGARPDRCNIQAGNPTICWGEKDAKPFAIVWNPVANGMREVPVPKGLRIVSSQVAVPRWLGANTIAGNANSMRATPNPAIYFFESATHEF